MKRWTIVLIMLVLASSLLALRGMSSPEIWLFRHIYDMPDSLRTGAVVATQLGTLWFLLFLAALLLVLRWNPKLSVLVLRNGVLAYGFAEILKLIVNRPRPYVLLDGVVSREFIVHAAGFPSGHTALATAVGLTIWPHLPKDWRWVIPLWIVVVAWSRMYLGVHAPLDIVGGLAIGALVASVPTYLGLPKHKRRRKLKKEV